jgi:hypothetical protein
MDSVGAAKPVTQSCAGPVNLEADKESWTITVNTTRHTKRRFVRPVQITEYNLASLGDVKSVSRPYGYSPQWTLEYKDRVSAKPGALIKPKT